MKLPSDLLIYQPAITTSVTALSNYRKQLVSYLITALLLLGQFAAVVHAADHPYHAADEFCEAYIHYQQQDVSADLAATPLLNVVTHGEIAVAARVNDDSQPSSVYYSRAPPLAS